MSTATRTLQSPLLVGRDQVLSLLDRRIDEAKAGRGTLLLFAGEAGIGKTRLMRAAIRKAEALGFKTDGGSLSPQDLLAPLQSIGDMGRSMLSNKAFGDLGADLLAMKGGKGGDSLSSRRILVHEIADRIVAEVDRPTALAFEDLQWADELSLEVIGELARSAPRLPLLLVADFRPEELPTGSIHREWRARLLTQRYAEEIRLERLDHDDTALITTLILGTGLPASRDVVDAVYERTNGIPLHIEELLAALGHEANGRTIRDAVVPDTIEDAVLARANRLSDDARSVARAGAILGRCFNPAALAGVMNRRPEDLDPALEELVAAAILHPFEYVDEGYYDFRHQLLRDALYQSVPAAERRRLHARVAEFGMTLAGANEIHASVHFERAGLKADAFRAAVAGAQAAGAMRSRYEEFELYRRAIANLPEGLTASELGDVYMAYCNASFSVDDIPMSEETGRLARRYFLEAGRPIDAAGTLIALASSARKDVRPRHESAALMAQAEAELLAEPPSADRSAGLADLRFLQAILEVGAGHLAEARALAQECLAFSLEFVGREDGEAAGGLLSRAGPGIAGLESTKLDVEHFEAWIDALDGDVAGGLSRMIDVSRQARDASFESSGVTGYRIAADVAARLMDYRTAALGVAEGLRYADEIEQSYCRRVLAATSAHLAWAEGRWDDAVREAEIELVEPGSRRGTLGSRSVLGYVAAGRGDVERARRQHDEALAIARPSGEIALILPALWGLAETWWVAGEAGRAFDHCLEALEIVAPTSERALLIPFVVTGTRAAIAARRPEAAGRWLERVRDLLTDWRDVARPALDHAEGLVRLAAGSTSTARPLLESAIAGWDERGRIWEATWARLDLGTCLVRANRYGEALVVLEQVRQTALGLGSTPVLERADELVKLARARGGEVEPWHPLSAREFEVAKLIADGLTNAEIGDELFVSPKTVSAHVEHMLAKLGVARRAEIAAWVATVGATAAHKEPAAAVATAAR